MKIRKAQLPHTDKVYIYENKKEAYHLIAVPSHNWSAIVAYEDSASDLVSLLKAAVPEEEAELLAVKISQWITEM